MKLGFFPGCSLLGSSREYLESIVARPRNGLARELADWNCCARAPRQLIRALSLGQPARDAGARREGGRGDGVPCSACFSRLAVTKKELLEDEPLRKRIADIIEMDVRATSSVLNMLDVLTQCGEAIKANVVAPFKQKVACYYGCYLARPAGIAQCTRPEDPTSMDDLMKLIGAEPIDWAFKVECCGAGLSVSRTDVVGKLSARIVKDAARRGAEAIVVACPMCHVNLDMRRDVIEKELGESQTIPVLYVTQVIGLALGLDAKTLGLHRHFVPVRLSERGAGCCAAGMETAGAAKG